MRWTPDEFIVNLKNDPAMKAMFIEGNRDEAFWKLLVPVAERNDAVIYPIANIHCDKVLGGERGRLLWFARLMENTPFTARIKFFADADHSRRMQEAVPSNVILTDGRDLEGYGFNDPCAHHICCIAFAKQESEVENLINSIIDAGRPIGLLRLAAVRADMNLPFQRVLEGDIRGFAKMVKKKIELDLQSMIGKLLQVAVSLNTEKAKGVQVSQILALIEEEGVKHNGIAHREIVHGKDLLAAAALYLDVDWTEMERHLFSAIAFHLNIIRQEPNLSVAEAWVRL